MTLKELGTMFNRAFAHAFHLKKIAIMVLALILSGIVFLFFQAIAVFAPTWLKLPIQAVPLFLLVAFLLAAGSLMVRLYHGETGGESPSVFSEVGKGWEKMLRASYFALPLLLAFILFWVLIGVFIFLKSIPFIGVALGVVLAFGPFLLALASIFLCFAVLFVLFFLLPPLSLGDSKDWKFILKQVCQDLFSHLLLLGIGLVPVWIIGKFVTVAGWMTVQLYAFQDRPFVMVLQLFFMLIPFAAIMTVPLLFFFNFSVESYRWREARIAPQKGDDASAQ